MVAVIREDILQVQSNIELRDRRCRLHLRGSALICCILASIELGSISSGASPKSPSMTARSVAWPRPVSASDP